MSCLLYKPKLLEKRFRDLFCLLLKEKRLIDIPEIDEPANQDSVL